jgi:hypothetical protein
MEVCGLGLSGSGWGLVVGFCERGSEPSGSIRGGEFHDQLRDYQLRKKTLLHELVKMEVMRCQLNSDECLNVR